MFEQSGGVAVVETLRRGHLLEERGMLVQQVAHQAFQARVVDVALDQVVDRLEHRLRIVITALDQIAEVVTLRRVAFLRETPVEDLDLHAIPDIPVAPQVQAVGESVGPGLGHLAQRVARPERSHQGDPLVAEVAFQERFAVLVRSRLLLQQRGKADGLLPMRQIREPDHRGVCAGHQPSPLSANLGRSRHLTCPRDRKAWVARGLDHTVRGRLRRRSGNNRGFGAARRRDRWSGSSRGGSGRG